MNPLLPTTTTFQPKILSVHPEPGKLSLVECSAEYTTLISGQSNQHSVSSSSANVLLIIIIIIFLEFFWV